MDFQQLSCPGLFTFLLVVLPLILIKCTFNNVTFRDTRMGHMGHSKLRVGHLGHSHGTLFKQICDTLWHV